MSRPTNMPVQLDSLAIRNELSPIGQLKVPNLIQLMDLALIDTESLLFSGGGRSEPVLKNGTTYSVKGELGTLRVDRYSAEAIDEDDPRKSYILDKVSVRDLPHLTGMVALSDAVEFYRTVAIFRGVRKTEIERASLTSQVVSRHKGFPVNIFSIEQTQGNQGFIRHTPGQDIDIPAKYLEKFKNPNEDTDPDLLLYRAAAVNIAAASLAIRAAVENPVLLSRKVNVSHHTGFGHALEDPYPIKNGLKNRSVAVVAAIRG